MTKMLYIIRGLPGSGKSTLSQQLADSFNCRRFEADMFHYMVGRGEYAWRPHNAHRAHVWCQTMVENEMKGGRPVVVSNTSTTEKELKPYLDMAAEHGYHVTSLIVENRHGNVSIHDVPEETMQRMQDRFSVKLR